MSSNGRRLKDYTWNYRESATACAERLQQDLQISPVVARVVANRGLADCGAALQEFARPALATLHDPFRLCDMQRAVERLASARQRGEHVTIYGDYDSDGITSTSLLLRTFRYVGISCDFYIPHRLDEGYGMNLPALDLIRARGTNLIVTVDTGICAVEQVRYAMSHGMEVIVTDHHQPDEHLPEAIAVVNPNRHDCTYPTKGLTGVGVAFKVAHALLKSLSYPPQQATAFLRSLLELVAIGTIADFAPLTAENRVLVSHGLDQMANSQNAGIRELKRVAEILGGRPSTHQIGFQVAPRLNAAGRTHHAAICVELLTTEDSAVATEIARQLETLNQQRRTVEGQIFEQCLRYLDDHPAMKQDRVLVVHGQCWHLGVIGIVASKIMDLYDRPVIILSEQKGVAKGSARSIKMFNIHQALHSCSEHLLTFGGHPNAAGLQLLPEKVDAFRRAINAYALEVLDGQDLRPSLLIDTDVQATELNDALRRDLGMLEPYGHSNPAPMLSVRNLRLAEKPKIVGTNHLKLQFKCEGVPLSGIAFNMGGIVSELGGSSARFDVAFVPTINTYWQQPRVELEVKDMKIRMGA